MLGHLDEKESQQYYDILKVRALGRDLNLEEQLIAELLTFDFEAYAIDSDYRKSMQAKEEDLVSRIDVSSLPDGTKMKLLRCFASTPEFAAASLQEYAWLRQWPYREQNPTSGRLGLLFNTDVTTEEYNTMLVLQARFNELGAMLIAGNATGRLLMTDDTPPGKAVREIADKEFADHRESFHFGVALSDKAQDLLDNIIRQDKDLIQRIIDTGAGKTLFPAFNVMPNAFRDTTLITISTTSDTKHYFGFYFNPRFRRIRQAFSQRALEHVPERRREYDNQWANGDAPQRRPKDHNVVDSMRRRRDREENYEVSRGVSVENKIEYRSKPAAAAAALPIPEMPVKKKAQPLASAKPMEVPTDAPKKKVQKTAPKKRKQQFEVLRLHSS